MQKLKVLKIIFNGEMRAHEIPALRGAIAQKAGLAHVLFHNHVNGGYRYAYPLIQYKCIHNRPCIVCIGEGVEVIYHFFEKKDWSIRISERNLDMQIDRLDMNQFTMQVWDKQFQYRLRNWIALSQHNWREYEAIDSLGDRIAFLERKLIGNILSFAKGIGWHVDKPIELKILDLPPSRFVKVKGVRVRAFSPLIRTNVFLPNDIGLGGKVSVGYGTVRVERRELVGVNS